ncbi:MAG: hypothetical protein WC755_01150 [Candidatus Woesearchaeota archaeon]|jgi:hypothetical protein
MKNLLLSTVNGVTTAFYRLIHEEYPDFLLDAYLSKNNSNKNDYSDGYFDGDKVSAMIDLTLKSPCLEISDILERIRTVHEQNIFNIDGSGVIKAVTMTEKFRPEILLYKITTENTCSSLVDKYHKEAQCLYAQKRISIEDLEKALSGDLETRVVGPIMGDARATIPIIRSSLEYPNPIYEKGISELIAFGLKHNKFTGSEQSIIFDNLETCNYFEFIALYDKLLDKQIAKDLLTYNLKSREEQIISNN